MDKIEITVKQDDNTLCLSFHQDSTIFQIAEHLKTILTFLTFTPITINEIIRGLDEEWEEISDKADEEADRSL